MRFSVVMKLAVAMALVSTWFLTGCQPQEEQQALELLARARTAEQTVSLEGQVQTELARPGGTVQAQAEVQRTPERTVVKFTEGPAKGKEMVREQGQEYQRRDEQHPGARHLPGVMDRIPSLEELTKRYDVELGPETDIAGRRVREVTVRPREGRSGQSVSLWIDVESGFPLGHERRDAFGRVVYATRYLQVKYGKTRPLPLAAAVPSAPAPPAAGAPATPSPAAPAASPGAVAPSTPRDPGSRPLRPHPPTYPGAPPGARPGPPSGDRPRPEVVSLEQLGQILGFAVTPPSFVPEGFTLRRIMVTKEAEHGRRGILHYSDGVAALTVIAGRREDTHLPPPPGADAPGGAAVVTRSRGSFAVALRGTALYLVSGPVPDDTLQRVAASVP